MISFRIAERVSFDVCADRRRLFRLQMLASAGVCYGVGLLLSLLLFFYLSPYLQTFIKKYIPVTAHYYPLVFAVLFLIAYLAVTFIWKALVNNLFVKEELQQTEKLKNLVPHGTKTLRLQEIMEETIEVIRDTLNVESIYICMQEISGGPYKGIYSDKPLSDLSFSLDKENPLIRWLQRMTKPCCTRNSVTRWNINPCGKAKNTTSKNSGEMLCRAERQRAADRCDPAGGPYRQMPYRLQRSSASGIHYICGSIAI